jgi:amidase
MLRAVPSVAFAKISSRSSVNSEVDSRSAPYHAISGHAALFNYSGHPALAIPAGVDADGLPIGVQLVARRWDDARLIAIARAIEPLAGGVHPPPGV